jgi:hypothetical protein
MNIHLMNWAEKQTMTLTPTLIILELADSTKDSQKFWLGIPLIAKRVLR